MSCSWMKEWAAEDGFDVDRYSSGAAASNCKAEGLAIDVSLLDFGAAAGVRVRLSKMLLDSEGDIVGPMVVCASGTSAEDLGPGCASREDFDDFTALYDRFEELESSFTLFFVLRRNCEDMYIPNPPDDIEAAEATLKAFESAFFLGLYIRIRNLLLIVPSP